MVCVITFLLAKEFNAQVKPDPVFVEVPVYIERFVEPTVESNDESPYYEAISNSITQAEIDMLASITYLEAGNQSMAGRRAVVEVILNRVMSDEFPDSIEEVLYQKGQFTPASMISSTAGGEKDYLAVRQVLCCQFPILEGERLFFSTSPQKKDYVQIGDHYFC